MNRFEAAVKFGVEFLPAPAVYDASQIMKRIRVHGMNSPEVYYVGLNSSANKNGVVDVIVKPASSYPMILVLNAAKPVTWKLNVAESADLRAVVYSDAAPGTKLVGINELEVEVFNYRRVVGRIPLDKVCTCKSGVVSCEGGSQNLFATHKDVFDVTAQQLSRYVWAGSTTNVSLPGTSFRMSSGNHGAVDREIERKAKEQCAADAGT